MTSKIRQKKKLRKIHKASRKGGLENLLPGVKAYVIERNQTLTKEIKALQQARMDRLNA
jgi:hypothetical protein